MLRTMMRKFPLFHDLISNVENGLAKADLSIAHRYSLLVEDEELRARVWRMIAEEFERTQEMILRVTGQRDCWSTPLCRPFDSSTQSLRRSDEFDSDRTAAATARRRGDRRVEIRAGGDDQRHLGRLA